MPKYVSEELLQKCFVQRHEGLYRCGECGKTYCEKCAVADARIKTLGVCSDCEEVYEAEEDYWGWK